MDESSKDAQNKQSRLYILLVAVLFVVVGAVSYYVLDEEESPVVEKKKTFDLPGRDIDPNQVLISRVEKQNQNLDAKFKYLESLLLDGKKKESDQQLESAELKDHVLRLRREINDMRQTDTQKEIPPREISYEDPFFSAVGEGGVPMRAPLVELVADNQNFKLKNVENVIPAGTTVKAILVSSLDANCSTFSSVDPQPVKLRMLDDGHLPKGVTVHLKGGIALGSAYGDISSERAYIRLERLTQVNPSGDFIETEVTGFVSGEDGKYGLRGVVVDRSEKQISNAALSGFFSGVSQLAQAAIDAKYAGYYYGGCDDGGNKCLDPNLLGEAALSGTSSAFDRLSDYYIKRSEQIRPVIQVDAGRVVDITFTHAVEIGDLHTKRKLEDIREKARGGVCAR